MGIQVAAALGTLAAGLILLMVWATFAPESTARERRRTRAYERERDKRVWKAIASDQIADPRTVDGEPIDAMIIRRLRGGSRGQNGQAVGVRAEGPEV